MINSNQWGTGKKYQQSVFQTNKDDMPLICQVSGSFDSNILATAKDFTSLPNCVAIDINLGCCQKVAKRGNYGYFLVENENKRRNVIKMVEEISNGINVPLCVKIRMIENDVDITANFAQQLEKAGAKIITVHARSAEQDKSGDINIECIKKIVQSVKIPVIANGGIDSKEKAKKILEESGAAGVMIGQALLKNPALFCNDENLANKTIFDIAKEYIEIAKDVGGAVDTTRKHMFYMFDKILGNNNEDMGGDF